MKVAKKTIVKKTSTNKPKYTEGVDVEMYNGKPTLCIPLYGEDSDYKFKFGARKAQAILKYLSDIKLFVEQNAKEK